MILFLVFLQKIRLSDQKYRYTLRMAKWVEKRHRQISYLQKMEKQPYFMEHRFQKIIKE